MVSGRRFTVAALVLLGSLANVARVRAEVSFGGIPAASDVASSQHMMDQRIARVIAAWSSRPVGQFPRSSKRTSFASVAMAKLFVDRDVDMINRALLDPLAAPYAAYGSQVTVIPGLCQRTGDYDFMAQDLIRLAYANMRRPQALWPSATAKIARMLLPAAGSRHHESFRLGICGRHRDSENHILMTESSRYLTNQLRRRLGDLRLEHNNAANGFDAWMLRHLAGYLKHHFEEYNSRPYQGYTVQALNNLQSFADSPEVRRSAQMVLDYLSAVFAVQSNGLRRDPPFRRQPRYAGTRATHDHDPETARFALLAGNYRYLQRFDWKVPYGDHFMLGAALSHYRVPEQVLDLIVRKDQGPSYQRLRHDGVEIYASSPSFLISAGGVFVRNFQFGSDEQHGWARATQVIPSRDLGTDTRAWIRVRGSDAAELRNNSCVAPGFMCGLNIEIPASIPAACRERRGSLELLDLTAPRCSLDLGYYVAVRRVACDSGACSDRASTYGAAEIREARGLTFSTFADAVTHANRKLPFRSAPLSSFVTSDGRRFDFEVLADRNTWPIVAVDGKRQQRDFAAWPRADGDVIRTRGNGLVMIDNPFTRQRLMLDARDPLRPARSFVPLGEHDQDLSGRYNVAAR